MSGTSPSTLPGDAVVSRDRLDALIQTGLWRSGPEESFDRLTRVAAKVLGMPVSLVTLVGDESQFLKSSAAPANEFPQGDEAPLSHSFCQHIVRSGGMLIVEDAECHPLVSGNAAIVDYDVKSYLGVPLRAGEHVIGAFCALGFEPRTWSAADVETLADIAAGVQAAIDYRLETIALQERESFLETIFASAPQSLTVVNRRGELIEANTAACTVAEVGSRDELLGRNVIGFVHPDDRVKVEEQHRRSLGGERLCETFRTVGRAGTTRTLRSHLTPLLDADGRVEAVLAISEDVTVLERLDATLDVHRDVVSSLDVGVYVLELDDAEDVRTFRVAEANAGSERASGVAPAKVLGRLVVDAFGDLATPAILETFGAIVDGGDPVAFGDVEAGNRVFDVRGVPLPGPRMALTFANVTEQRRLEGRARQSQKMEAVGQLAGGVAHDFNNLLTAITGYTTLAREQAGANSDLEADLDEVLLAADRARELTRQLLAFGRQQFLHPTPLNLNEVVTDAERLLERVLGEDVLIESRLGAVPVVQADRGQVEQVLVNLAVNGRDAMPGGGTLVLATGAEHVGEGRPDVPDGMAPGLYATLTVSDSGTGITAEIREKIFEPFFTTKEFGEGHGLGLSTVHGIVQQSGGQIVVATSEGRGTTFTVYLPAVSDSAIAVAVAPTEAPARQGSERVVVVEDEDLVRNLTVRTLEAHGYEVVAFADPAEALANLPDDFALLVTDVVMPKLSGHELAEKVMRLVPSVRVIFVSGYAPEHVLARGVREDVVEFLQKPFSMNDLARLARRVLDDDARAWDGFVRGPASSEHAAHVYGDADELAETASGYLSLGLELGNPAIVISTPAHWDCIAARLAEQGWPAERIEASGLLTRLDAADTLERIAPGGTLSQAHFDEIVGGLVREVAARHPGCTVRAFGEMVDLLYTRGDLVSALELEACWSALLETERLSLLCGYGADVFDPETQRTVVSGICATHTHVLSGGDSERLDAAVDRALQETLGRDAARIHANARLHASGSIPHGQRVLRWLSEEMPDVAGIVLATARDHYAEGSRT